MSEHPHEQEWTTVMGATWAKMRRKRYTVPQRVHHLTLPPPLPGAMWWFAVIFNQIHDLGLVHGSGLVWDLLTLHLTKGNRKQMKVVGWEWPDELYSLKWGTVFSRKSNLQWEGQESRGGDSGYSYLLGGNSGMCGRESPTDKGTALTWGRKKICLTTKEMFWTFWLVQLML